MFPLAQTHTAQMFCEKVPLYSLVGKPVEQKPPASSRVLFQRHQATTEKAWSWVVTEHALDSE